MLELLSRGAIGAGIAASVAGAAHLVSAAPSAFGQWDMLALTIGLMLMTNGALLALSGLTGLGVAEARDAARQAAADGASGIAAVRRRLEDDADARAMASMQERLSAAHGADLAQAVVRRVMAGRRDQPPIDETQALAIEIDERSRSAAREAKLKADAAAYAEARDKLLALRQPPPTGGPAAA